MLLLPRMLSSSQPQIDDERQNFGLKVSIDVGNKQEKLKKNTSAKENNSLAGYERKSCAV